MLANIILARALSMMLLYPIILVFAAATSNGGLVLERQAHKDCTTFDPENPPFPGAICREITKSDGTQSVIAVNNFYISNDSAAQPNGLKNESQTSSTKWYPGEGDDRAYCDTSSSIFSSKSTNPYAPEAADCVALASWVTEHDGHWVVSKDDMDARNWTALAMVDTCAFVVGSLERYRQEWGLASGNIDIAELIDESISRYQLGSKVEVLGQVGCLTWSDEREDWTNSPMDWWIVRPDMVNIGGPGDEEED